MGFTFLDSYWEAATMLDTEERRIFIDAIVAYAMTGEIPELPHEMKPLFILVRPNIDKSVKNYQDGKKGGRPPKNHH